MEPCYLYQFIETFRIIRELGVNRYCHEILSPIEVATHSGESFLKSERDLEPESS